MDTLELELSLSSVKAGGGTFSPRRPVRSSLLSGAISRSSVRSRFNEFKRARDQHSDDSREGRPATAITNITRNHRRSKVASLEKEKTVTAKWYVSTGCPSVSGLETRRRDCTHG
ncbi:hypothetical protein EVAR_46976_1 [Eumeta japonica]|uniref:Uncharacterized protein n=1 Tax=Eumeta variegata TaxID=151549 RepID=A0A4C1X9H9_EUMVA|nr:hypothetical protein EVAR_46976_1 [Eumeta japonica]